MKRRRPLRRTRANNAERETIERLEKEGWTVYTRGWPDLLATRGDEVVGIEVKSAKWRGKVSRQQALIHAVLRRVGMEIRIHKASVSGMTKRKPGDPWVEPPTSRVPGSEYDKNWELDE